MAASTEDQEYRTVQARVVPEFHEEIRIEAAKRDVSISDLVRDSLKSELGE